MNPRLRILLLTAILPCFLEAGGTGSLWQTKGSPASMFSDRKGAAIGDIVTVVVQESSSISASKSTSTEKTSDVLDLISKIVQTPTGELPGNTWSSSSAFEGGGEISNTQSASSSLSVVVIDRLPNGNLVIEGMRKVIMADEVNYAVLRGYIRPDDISSDNTILSSRIADAQIEFVAEGALTEAQRRGWLTRIYSFLNPF